MGTNTTRKNKFFTPIPRLMSGGDFITKNSSPYFYGVVTFVDPETRTIQYDIIENNIGTGKLGNAIPAYKDNITLPQIQDVVPLFTGPSFESGVLGEQYTKTVYYGNPISILQELSENSLVRSSEFSAVPPEVIPNKENYLISDIGLSFMNDQSSGTRLLMPTTSPYNTYKPGQKLPNGKIVPPGYVITVPVSNVSKQVALVFGGMHYANAAWMSEEIPPEHKSRKIFVCASACNPDGKSSFITLNAAERFISENFVGSTISSISGFSWGGKRVWECLSKGVLKYPFLGLIDPTTNSTNVNNLLAVPNPNIIMAYRPNNWAGTSILSTLKDAASKMGRYAIYLKKESSNSDKLVPVIPPPKNFSDDNGGTHSLIPKWFFENYGGRL